MTTRSLAAPARLLGLCLGLGLLLSACTESPAPTPTTLTPSPGPTWFTDVAAESGLTFMHVQAPLVRYWFPEIMSGGACWIDADGDDTLDLYVVQGGALSPEDVERPGNVLYHNNGDGSFTDITAAAGVGDASYGNGCTVGDIDNDGDADLYVTNVGPNVLYHNNGDGTFTDITAAAGVGDTGWGTSAVFFDSDGDPWLDLYITNYVDWAPEREIECFSGGAVRDYCQPNNYSATAADAFYRGGPGGRFVEAADAAGFRRANGNGLGVTPGDFNGDGHLDLYIANDGNPNQLWINRGDGTFDDQALRSGSAVNRRGMAEAGMGVAAFDLENDGDVDLFLTHLRDETNTFYRNDGGLFTDATIAANLSVPSIPFTGFGTGAADFNHDGNLDLYVANGRVGRARESLGSDPFGEPNQLYRGDASGRFEEVFPRGGTDSTFAETSRAAAFADYDNDGDVDIVVVNNNGPLRLLRNDASAGNWVQFRVLNRYGRDAVGATVRVVAGDQAWWRLVSPAYSYQASNDPRVHVGLGNAATIDSIRVVWPGGTTESFGPLSVNQIHVLRDGR